MTPSPVEVCPAPRYPHPIGSVVSQLKLAKSSVMRTAASGAAAGRKWSFSAALTCSDSGGGGGGKRSGGARTPSPSKTTSGTSSLAGSKASFPGFAARNVGGGRLVFETDLMRGRGGVAVAADASAAVRGRDANNNDNDGFGGDRIRLVENLEAERRRQAAPTSCPKTAVKTTTTTADDVAAFIIYVPGYLRWTKEELKAAFLMLDQNKDGTVNASELQAMLLNLGIHLREEFIHELIKEAGCTGSGINESEFMQWMGKLVLGTSSSSAAAAAAARHTLHEHIQEQEQKTSHQHHQRPAAHAHAHPHQNQHQSQHSHGSSSSTSSSSPSRTGSSSASPSPSSSSSPSSSGSSHGDEENVDDVTQDLIAAFTVFDRDGNGYITRDELKLAMDLIGEPMTDPQLDHMLELADVDKDGRINYQEFLRILL